MSNKSIETDTIRNGIQAGVDFKRKAIESNFTTPVTPKITVEQRLKNNLDSGYISQQDYTDAMKTFELMKGKGEGSKGGKVIGHTKSGKAVYANKKAKDLAYADFDTQDHKDAHKLHDDLKYDYREKEEYDKAKHHADIKDSHIHVM